jgi:hypothetical protein
MPSPAPCGRALAWCPDAPDVRPRERDANRHPADIPMPISPRRRRHVSPRPYRRAHAMVVIVLACAGLPAAAQAQELGIEEQHPVMTFPAFHLGLFGNVDYVAMAAAGDNSGFRNGGLDLFVTSQLSERWSGLVEMLFEAAGGTLITDLERIQVNYDHSDELRLTAGRIHSPLARWNLSIHHGVFLQTPIDRPAMTVGEDAPGVFPIHFVGLLASGRLVQFGGITYTAGIGNGRAPVLEQVQITRDANEHKAIIVGLGISPPAVVGLDVSVTGYIDRIPAETGAIDERDFTLSASYLARGWELRGEWGRMHHEPAGSNVDYDTDGWYLLMSRGLPGNFETVRPYVMVDRLEVPAGFEFFERVRDRSAWMAGLRWDADPAVALKVDYRSQRIGGGERDGLVRLQLAFSLN